MTRESIAINKSPIEAINNPVFDVHAEHEVYVDLFPRNKRGELITYHPASLRCRTCNKWITWLNLQQIQALSDYHDQ